MVSSMYQDIFNQSQTCDTVLGENPTNFKNPLSNLIEFYNLRTKINNLVRTFDMGKQDHLLALRITKKKMILSE